jgi:hypothetical protein
MAMVERTVLGLALIKPAGQYWKTSLGFKNHGLPVMHDAASSGG